MPTEATISESRGLARVGIIVPFSNTNLEPDMAMMRPSGVSLHFTRADGYDLDKVPNSDQMRKFAATSLPAIMRSIGAAQPDMVIYGCTSATLSHGITYDIEFREDMEKLSGVIAATAAGALVEALTDLGVNNPGFGSPYTQQLNHEGVTFLQSAGFNVPNIAYVGSDLGNYGQGELTLSQVYQLGLDADHPNADSVVLSCTDMRAVEVIDALEKELGKPVISSNQALMYIISKRLGLQSTVPGMLSGVLPMTL